VVNEVGYIRERKRSEAVLQLVSFGLQTVSLILTSNMRFARWGDVFGDQVVRRPPRRNALLFDLLVPSECRSRQNFTPLRIP